MNPDTKNAKILIIDDEPGWRDLFVWELSSQGYRVIAAGNGAEAIEKSNSERFDLIITDVKMPGMDGVDAFVAIRKVQPRVKVILVTGYAVEERVQEGLNSKATTCIRKPFDLASMLQAIRQTLAPLAD